MIDEVDNGVHYSRMEEFLKTILRIADKNSVQLFMTTHSNECLMHYKEALNNKDMKKYREKTRSYTLKELPDKSIKAYKYNIEEFDYAIEKDIELRGGVR